jgi:hypothetical protein
MYGSHLGEHQAGGGRDGVVAAGAGRSGPSAHPGPVAGWAGHHGRDRGDFPDFADRGDAPLGGVGRGRTDRQSQAGRGRRHCLNAVTLERPRGGWAGPVEAGFASGLLRLLGRAERWCASRSGRSESAGGDRVGRGWVAAESNSRATGEPRGRPAGSGSHRRKRSCRHSCRGRVRAGALDIGRMQLSEFSAGSWVHNPYSQLHEPLRSARVVVSAQFMVAVDSAIVTLPYLLTNAGDQERRETCRWPTSTFRLA